MTQSTTHIDDAIRKIAVKLAKQSITASPNFNTSATQRQINSSARILVDSDPKWIELARAKMFKQAKPKQGGW